MVEHLSGTQRALKMGGVRNLNNFRMGLNGAERRWRDARGKGAWNRRMTLDELDFDLLG